MQALPSFSFRSFLHLHHHLPLFAAAALVVLGLVYLFLGRRFFRLLIVAAGAAVGFQIGLLVAAHFALPPLLLALPAALLAGGLAWPLWQVALFLVGGAAGALVAGEALAQTTGTEMLYGFLAGFVLGGVLALLLFKAMSIGLTALLGASMVYLGGVTLLQGKVALFAKLPSMPLLSAAVIGVLTLMGIVAQLAQPEPEVKRRRKLEDAERRSKARDDERAKKSYDRYLGNDDG